MKNTIRATTIFAFFAIFLLSNSGCTFVFSTKKVQLTSSDSTTQISYINNSKGYKYAGEGAKTIRAKWYFPLIVKQEREGYIPMVSVCKRTKFNPIVILDLISSAAFLVGALTISSDILSIEYKTLIIFYGALYPLYPLIISKGKTFPNNYQLPEMQEIPKRDSLERFLLVNITNVNIPKDSIIHYTYESTKAVLENNNASSIRTDRKVIEYNDSELKHDMNRILQATGFADTTGRLFPSNYNSLFINTTIRSLKTHFVAGFGGYVSLGVEFSLHEFNDDKELYSTFIVGKSDYLTIENLENENAVIESIIQNTIYQFLEDDSIRPFMKSQEEKYQEQIDKYDEFEISEEAFAQNKSEAISAVVTITKGKSHGSGCLISSNGYIITNFHVSGTDDSKLKILFENGKESSCKLIRYNAKYDLALLKTDSTGIKPLKVVMNSEIPVGDDVYAIGTPADIELGQSISKGIVSGKRKNNDLLYIQTDVSVNPGNSGGALINENGELIGIINAKLFGDGIEGIGFAIPACYIKEALKITFNY